MLERPVPLLLPYVRLLDVPQRAMRGPNGRRGIAVLACGLAGMLAGCNSLLNSWLDPSQVGNFFREGTLEIRGTLSIQDSPPGIPGATDPIPEDLVPHAVAYKLEPGDTVNIRVLDLVGVNTETNVQVTLDEEGTIALPIIGRLRASGLTAGELEAELKDILRQRDVLLDAQVVVDTAIKRGQTFSVFGAISNPSVFPIPQPDFRVLEALSFAGGLVDTVTEIYVFRQPTSEPASAYSAGSPRIGARPRLAQAAAREATLGDGFAQPPPPPAPTTGDRQPTTTRTAPRDDVPMLERALRGTPEEREIIDAVLGEETGSLPAATEPAEPTPVTGPATEPAVEAEPRRLPRFIFLNGQWIETQPTATQPETAPSPTVPGEPAVPTRPMRPPAFPETEPVVDWSEVAGESEVRIIRVSGEGLRDGDPRQNIVVRPGDTIRVLAGEVGEYYIMGQVIRAGAYTITGRRVTLKQAIAAAGNIAPLGWPDRCTVYRRYGDREEMKQVNLDAMFAGKEADLFLKKDDLIVVGTHPIAPFLATIRNAFRMTYGFGFVYDRNFGDLDAYGAQINPENRQPRFPNLFQQQ